MARKTDPCEKCEIGVERCGYEPNREGMHDQPYPPCARNALARVAKLEPLIVKWAAGYQQADPSVDDMLVAAAARLTKKERG